MTTKRFNDNPELVQYTGNEVIPLQAMDGGEDTDENAVAPGDDAAISLARLVALAKAIKVTSVISAGAIAPAGNTDIVRPAALTAALTIANPATTPVDGWGMVIELKDNGTARALTWGTKYASRIGTLPTTTVAGKQHIIGISYNAAADKLYCDFAVVQA